MVSIEYSKAFTEVLDILNHTNKKDVNKISPVFMNFLKENSSKEYNPQLDHTKRIKEMNLNEKTIGLLSVINSKFWCTPEQKIEFENKLQENEIKYQASLKEKYNSDTIFENNSQNVSIQNISLVQTETKWYKKLFHEIIEFFK